MIVEDAKPEIRPPAGAAAGADGTTTPPAADAAADAPDLSAQVADMSSALAAMREQLQALAGEKAAAEAAAAEAKKAAELANMTAAEKHEAELKELRLKVAVMNDRNAERERNAALVKLGVKDRYLKFAPNVDVTTDDGAAALEQWAKDHPEILNASPTSPATIGGARFESDLKARIDAVPRLNGISLGNIEGSLRRAAELDAKMNGGTR